MKPCTLAMVRITSSLGSKVCVRLASYFGHILYLIKVWWQIIPDIIAAYTELQLLLGGIVALTS